MVPLSPATSMSVESQERLELWLYGTKEPIPPAVAKNVGFLGWDEQDKEDLSASIYKTLSMIGFTGSDENLICESGLFFSQVSLSEKEGIELFAASSFRWMFGAPGLARWKEGETTKYCTGVFARTVDKKLAKPLLLT
jgi:hypothetical protein